MDFYLLDDYAPRPHPSKLKQHVGRLEYEEFEALQKFDLIEKHLDYYQDLRWSFQDVEQKLRKAIELDKSQCTEIDKFKEILSLARQNRSGLIAYGD